MADSKRIIRPLISLLIIAATALGLVNVYADNAAVIQLAEQTACGDRNCAVTMTHQERNPFTQSFTFQTDLKTQTTAEVSCHRSLYLLGEYSCQRRQ